MAFLSATGSRERLAEAVGQAFAKLRAAIAYRRAYMQARHELEALSTLELRDLGISRSMITRLAHEAARKG